MRSSKSTISFQVFLKTLDYKTQEQDKFVKILDTH